MNHIKEIRNLINYLNEHTRYYDEGNPQISDAAWDKTYFKLQELEKEYSVYYNDSPTQYISYEVVNSLEKVAHNHDMLSLEKTKALTEIKDFLGNVPYLAMCKMDGLTCSLKYYDGLLVSAETRGDGQVGENILHNARVISSIPKYIPYKGTLVVDGEIICSKDDFKEFESEYKNPRNFAAGSIRLLDAQECSKRKLQFIAWEVIEGFEDEELLSNRLFQLNKCGFCTVPMHRSPSITNTEQSGKTLEMVVNELVDLAINYPIDGIVFKYDNIEYGRSLGKTAHHFKNAMAYKFADETAETYLKEIEWSMGRTGVLTPIAIFEEVELDGSTIARASLHNLSIMKEILDVPYIGQMVEIFKANMIIPQIKSASHEPVGKEILEVPLACPICGAETAVKIENLTQVLYCPNEECEGKIINKINHAIGKKGLDIKGLSKATLEKLMDWGWVSSYIDIFNLNQYHDEWVRKPGFGIKSVDKVLNAIEASKNCELSAFISSLGIPLIGTTASKELTKIFNTWEDFINAVESGYHFWSIPNFGTEMHTAIIKFDYTEAKQIYTKYLNISAVPASPIDEVADSLANITVVITGKVCRFKNRDELKAAIERRGGKVAGSISGKTHYLINNDVESTSSKNLSAKKLGVPIISEDAFIETFGLL